MKTPYRNALIVASILCAFAIVGVLSHGAAGPMDFGAGLATAMAVVQPTYNSRIPAGFEGQVANMTTYDADSRICETDAGIAFGRAIGQGTADKGAVLGGALTGFVGISVRDVTQRPSAEDKYEDGDTMAVMTRGDIWVVPLVDVAKNDPVHYVSATGRFTNTGDIGPIVGARYMTSASAGGLAQVRLSGHLP